MSGQVPAQDRNLGHKVHKTRTETFGADKNLILVFVVYVFPIPQQAPPAVQRPQKFTPTLENQPPEHVEAPRGGARCSEAPRERFSSFSRYRGGSRDPRARFGGAEGVFINFFPMGEDSVTKGGVPGPDWFSQSRGPETGVGGERVGVRARERSTTPRNLFDSYISPLWSSGGSSSPPSRRCPPRGGSGWISLPGWVFHHRGWP